MSEIKRKKLLVCAGTRADSIKMCPLYLSLKGAGWADVYFCNSGQHREMTDDVLSFFGVKPDAELSVMRHGQTPDGTVELVRARAAEYIAGLCPDMILVQGDTASSLGFAMAGHEAGCTVCHIEAGLRSWDERCPYPEEIYRKRISALAAYHFAPTERARENLLSEGIADSRIFVVGNTVIDALLCAAEREEDACEMIKRHDFSRPTLLLTLHRRENTERGGAGEVLSAVDRLLSEHPSLFVIFPMHKSEAVRGAFLKSGISSERLILCEPLDYPSFVYAMRRCRFLISDSGGVCEEAGYLGVPVLIAREKTERGESIDAGCAILCPPERERVYSAADKLLLDDLELSKLQKKTSAYGDGNACRSIAQRLAGLAKVLELPF